MNRHATPTQGLPRPLSLALLLTGYTVFSTLGLVTAWKLRIKESNAAVGAGLAVGGISFPLICLAVLWVVGAHASLGGSMREIRLLSAAGLGADKGAAQRELVELHPVLRDLPAEEQARLLRQKLVSDMVSRSKYGLLSGFGFALALCLFAPTLSIVRGKAMLDKHKGFWKALVPTLEPIIPLILVTSRLGDSILVAPYYSDNWKTYAAWCIVLCPAVALFACLFWRYEDPKWRWWWLCRVGLAVVWFFAYGWLFWRSRDLVYTPENVFFFL